MSKGHGWREHGTFAEWRAGGCGWSAGEGWGELFAIGLQKKTESDYAGLWGPHGGLCALLDRPSEISKEIVYLLFDFLEVT